MSNRYMDWLRQAEADLKHARNSFEDGDFEWCCFVAIKSVNRELIRQAVISYAAELRQRCPEVERVIWFGSWVTGLPSPGSDVDLCLILSSSDKPPRDRIPEYLPLGFPVGVDLFAYTHNEIDRLRHSSPGWYRAITSGVEI